MDVPPVVLPLAELPRLELQPLLDEQGIIDPRTYFDPAIHALEQERVFGRSWLLLCHESQLPEPRCFVTASMGEDPVVVTRQDDGTLAAFLNQCRHRGVPICRSDAGRARSFTCSYHGWTYDGRGRLLTIPDETRLFRCPLDRGQWSATPVPRVESRHGLVFGCWDPQAPSLEEWLGDARWCFDLAFDGVGGTEAIPGVSRRRIAANWKLAAEQAASDGYHVAFTHASAFAATGMLQGDPDAGARPLDALRMPLVLTCSRQGHCLGGTHVQPVAEAVLTPDPAVRRWLFGPRLEYLVSKYGARAKELFPIHMSFFPNLTGLFYNELRVLHPRGPGHMELWSWLLVDRAAPPEVKAAIRREQPRLFGGAGVFEADDVHQWVEIQRLLQGPRARRTRLNAQMDPAPEAVAAAGVPPGLHFSPTESGTRCFHRRWAELMAVGAGGAA